MSSTKFVFFGPIGKTRWPPWPLIGWDIFDFFSETNEQNSTTLDRKQDLNVLYQVCVFRADRKNKMAALASDWLRHFRLLFWNRWTGIQRNLTGSKLLMTSTKFVFFGSIWKTRWPPWPLIGWEIFDFSEETAERNSKKLDRKQDLNFLYQVCVFRADRKTRWPPQPLIGWDIFNFFSETAEWNSTKLDRKQDLNVFYQVCVFWADRKNKMAAPASDWMRNFRLLWRNRWTEFKETWQEARSQRPLPSVCFSGRSENKMAAPASDWLRHFQLLLWNRWMEFNETWQEARSQRLLPSLCFLGWSEIKMAAPASDWLRHFQFLLWNRWIEFDETWQEARSQHPLPSLCFSGRSVKRRWPPWPMIGWYIFDFSSETAERDSKKFDRKQDLNIFYQAVFFSLMSK